jgi:hypothetical protein
MLRFSGAATPSLSSGNSSSSVSPPFPPSPTEVRSVIPPPSTGYRNDIRNVKTPPYAASNERYRDNRLQINAPTTPQSSGSEYAATPGIAQTAFDKQSETHELSSDSEYDGLAYADSTAESEDEEPLPPGLRNRRSSARERVSASQARFSRESRKDRDLTPVRSRSKKAASASSSGGGHALGRASVTTSESNYSHNSTVNRITNILFEDDGASSLSKSKSSGSLIQNKISLPARSRTSPGPSPIASKHVPVDSPRLSASTSRATRASKEKERVGRKSEKKIRVCVRCEKHIEDGKWVQMDGGTVLCERCWKNMYLPKVGLLFFSMQKGC